MFILDEPYVSDLLRDTILESNAPVLDTSTARSVFEHADLALLSSAEFAAKAKGEGVRVYSNSENAIGWVTEHLADTDIPRRIGLFKDKVAFRELLRPLFPEYEFRELAFSELGSVDPAGLAKPFVVKPAVGFFSVGVYVVESDDAWPSVVAQIRHDVARSADLYPEQVLTLDRFIIEQQIDGEEFAVDAYYDATGKPVIVNILGHLFAGNDDTSDRAYYTSPSLVGQLRESVTALLQEVGDLAQLRDFPVHAEFRIDSAGKIGVIEVNPLRFGGWCATDILWHAFGINPYTTYLDDCEPDWARILKKRSGRACGLIVADFPRDIDRSAIVSVDYAGFEALFSRPIELRPVDFHRYPVFAFMFAEVPEDDFSELETLLHADLSTFLRMK